MAKSRRKARKSRPEPFYEALPVIAMPPDNLADLPAQIQLSFTTMQAGADELWSRVPALQKRVWDTAVRAGLVTTNVIIHELRRINLAARYAGDAAITYAPAIGSDIGTYSLRGARMATGRRARKLYLFAIIASVVATVAVGGVIASSTLKSYANDISSPSALLAKKKTGTTILDRNGQILFEGYGAQSTAIIALADLPKNVKDATLAAEDPDFYSHPGVSWRATARAAITDILHQRRAEGGSTLTQQLVKNALLTSDKAFERKYKEILLATEIEKRYSKDEILEMYLNETFYGQGATGVEAASQTYFRKSSKDLSLGEAALIAGLPLGPSRFDPNVNIEAATGRRNYVLGRLVEHGKITQAQADAAKAQAMSVASSSSFKAGDLAIYPKTIKLQAPHFVFYVLDQLRAQYGEDVIENGGITVKTTLDLNKQNLAQQTVTNRISQLSGNHVTNGGLVSIEPRTGDIVAMVGSIDYNAPGFGNVNVTLSQLQPGSSFKPIAYATAFKKGWNGITRVDDTPLSVPNADGTFYTPQNYDLKFRGPVTLRKALDNSLNIPAVKVLQFAGIHDTIQTAHDLGITSLQDESRFGLALVLGGGEVSPIDMATVYATFANGGTHVKPRAITSVTNRYGITITKPSGTTPKQALDPRIAYMISNILSDDGSRQPEFPANGPLKLSRPAAAKTGTTNDFRDNWTVGYTPNLSTAVWVGNNDHSAMQNVDGITGAAPIWHDYMEGALASTPVENFVAPSGISSLRVCNLDGGLANPWDSGYDEVFPSDALPTKRCASTFVMPVVTAAPNPADPAAPIQIPAVIVPQINIPRFTFPITR